MAVVRAFHRYRGESSITLKKLIAILKEQIPEVAPSQTKYRVTEVPTERTIRFYTGQGLVDKPMARDGARALYGYRHLLQILVVKYLQTHYLPLVKIRSLVENADNRELEMMIPAIASVTATRQVIARENRRPPDSGSPSSPSDLAAPSAGEDRPTPVDAPTADLDLWHRIEVAPGVELHVHAAALSPSQRERLRGALLREIGVLRGWFGDGGRS